MYRVLEFIIDAEGNGKAGFAKSLGITSQQLNSWLNEGKGHRPIPKKWAKEIADKYNINELKLLDEISEGEQKELYQHILKLKGIDDELIQKSSLEMDNLQERLNAHDNNVEILRELLLIVHKRELENANGLQLTKEEIIEHCVQKEIEFIEMVNKFLAVIYENDFVKMATLGNLLILMTEHSNNEGERV